MLLWSRRDEQEKTNRMGKMCDPLLTPSIGVLGVGFLVESGNYNIGRLEK